MNDNCTNKVKEIKKSTGMNYKRYKAEDFAAEDSFINYFLRSNKEDVIFWESWISDHPEMDSEIKQAIKLLELLTWKGSEVKFQHNLEQLKTYIGFEETALHTKQLVQPNTIRIIKWPALAGVAAAVIILLVVGVSIYRYRDVQQINNITQMADVAPGGNKAILTLADGRKIDLNNVNDGTLAEQTGIKIIKKADGMLVYVVDDQYVNEGSSAVNYNTIQTPKGGQYQVNLSDGTKVWLNAASSIRYPNLFKGKERKVEITGEAYFEVAKNSKMPFKVLVNNQSEVEVLGTHFNINAYPEDATVKTTLAEGSVRVSSFKSTDKLPKEAILKPGQQSLINQASGGIKVQPADLEEVLAWKQGDFVFKQQPLSQILEILSRWYSVEIEYDSEGLSQQTFSGVIARSKNLAAVLEMLESTGQINFKIEGKKIKVKNK